MKRVTKHSENKSSVFAAIHKSLTLNRKVGCIIKKTLYIIIPALMLTMLCVGGCEKPNTEKIDSVEVPVTPLTLAEGCFSINLVHDTVYIINSNEELTNYTHCGNDLPHIDFDRQTVLLACGVAPGGIYEATTELTETGTEYILNVDVLLDDSAIVGDIWRIALLTDKLTTNYIELNVSSHH
jgi:hypothetical protein